MKYKNLDLSSINKIWLTCEKTSDRWCKMESLLKDIGWAATKHVGEITNPYTIGVTNAHISALNQPGNILILEDDIAQNINIPSSIEVPEDADAIYVGTSLYGVVRGKTMLGGVIAGDYDNYLNKVFNMLGLHAIIYLTERYKQNVISLLKSYLDEPEKMNKEYGCDNPIASSHYKYNIYSVKIPWFYQADGHSDQATITPIDTVLC